MNIKYNFKDDYDFKNAKADGYGVYNNSDKIINYDEIAKFYNNSLNDINGRITIIRYTLEGDPFINQYYYQDGNYIMFEDATRDRYSNEIDKTILKETITKAEFKERFETEFLKKAKV